MPSWAIFDYGEVISQRTAALPSIAQLLGVGRAEFETAYFGNREPYDLGCADQAYWRAIAAELGITMDERLIESATDMDVAGWLHTRQDTPPLLAELHDAGVCLALLSNAPRTFARRIRGLAGSEAQPWTRHFRRLLFSGELGLLKPSTEIYKALCAEIDATPGECAFLDDKEDNVIAARNAGMHARVWAGADDARAWLTSLGLLGS